MLILKTSQLKLQEDGQITFQPDATNPMAGEVVARAVKGASALEPTFEAVNLPSVLTLEDIQKWWPQYLAETVEDLTKLDQGDDISGTALEIAKRLKESLGVIPRGDIEGLIAQLDEEGRRSLRARKVKLGPILVFLYTLNKPAAVRLRALLWSLYNDKPLPAKVPADGIVSATIENPEEINHDYYRAISYPVYGNRTVRIDMLDRVINLIYDSADKGRFHAKHEMAEWLGCSIADLYGVLEAMGHKKIHDPADEKVESAVEGEGESDKAEAPAVATDAATAATEVAATEAKEETADVAAAPADKEEVDAKTETEAATTENTAEKPSAPAQVKPELATFVLKKGKAHAAKQPFKKPADDKAGASKFKGKKPQGKSKPHKKGKPHQPPQPRVYSAPANEKSNSPFDVLKQLKADGDGS